jgi:superfamily I DNA and/or RNA helicase
MLNKSSNIIEKEFKNLRRELLDLTLRNQLLNFKSRAKTITIVNQSPVNLFQTLVLQNAKMYFVANKKDKKEDKSSVWDHIPFDFSKFSEGDRKLATDLTPKELQKRLYYINNQAKTMLQEQGYNILYLAVGFLEWKDKSKPRQKNKAPLVLIPVAMERKKVGESFNLEWTGEDIQTNISLKAKLLEAGLELPDFEFKRYGEVIDHYIASVNRAVSRMDGWSVNNDVALGFFSFTKFVMYNDLNPEAWADNVDLTKNELIQAIFNPAKNDQESFKEEDIDSQLEYRTMFQVLDGDSSQIAAIQDVKAGRNLVVEGPPGTGKSQTIVNLIAELLAEGKSVLFVSEKMAALDVVKDRLTGVGLGKFVLELHSHKTRRKKFLKDLQKATNVRAQEPLNIDQTIRKLETLRRQLDDYSQIIHKPVFAVNLSAFQLYGMKESADDHFARKDALMPLVRFESPETVTLKDLDDMKIALENLAELYQTISKENPWSKCAPKSLLPADLREIEMLINDSLLSLDNFLVERGRVYDIYGIKQPNTLNEFQNSLSAFEIIKSQNAELIDGSIIKSGAWNNNNDDAYLLIKELERYQKYAPALDKFNPSIYQADIDRLIAHLHQISNKRFRLFNSNQHIELVERYYAVPVSGSPDDIIRDLKQAKAIIKIRRTLEANDALGRKYYGGYWHLNANPDDLKAIARWMNEFTALVRDGTFSENTIELMSKDLYDIKPERDLAEYIDAGEEFVRVLSKLKDKLNPRSKLIFKRETGDVPFEAWKEQLYNWRGQLSSLHLWSQYLNTKNALKTSNAKMFVDSIEKRNIKKDDIEALVDGNFADSLLNILFVENHELATFVGELHENRIHEFKDLDKKILTLNRKRIYHKLNNNIPKIFGGTENPQAKILAGEFTRKSGHMPVRKLLEKAGGMIKQIKPCFMMSPLSIAQYLDPTNEELQFDVVIFDEASQVKPEDALGAFMRGKTAVVMGDTQQLPPTSFFDQMSDADSDEEEATSLDMESILHLCKLSFPVKMLKWHYRSRHESLITVSNREFYDDDLLVYPSPSHNDPELGLKFHYNPNTQYLRGASSANPLEAEDVADEIFNHFEKYGDTKSLGVGTFSVAQKNAILEALEVKRKERPEFEPLFSDNKEERFFVKNLETIQGDERDVILISVGYGYDQDGKMSLNFGPLNQDGGERRLNVLITRAREKCVVFSNFKAYDMKLTANPPYGVKSLKEFLEYAENLTLGTHTADEHSKEPFEDAIASYLEENGYTVDRQIGCAGFRVDLAIVDDENPGKYILGITTDGKMYSSSKVARDRDRLREQVLTGLGWKLYHLWSTDWYRNRDLGRKKLLENVEKSIRKSREEERRRSEEEKKLAEKRRLEAEKKAEELRLAREKEEKERAEKEAEENEVNPEDIGPNDFVEVEKVDDGDILEKPIDVSEINPEEFFEDGDIKTDSNDDTQKSTINEDVTVEETPSEFVVVDTPDEDVTVEETPSEFIKSDEEDGVIEDLSADGEVSDVNVEDVSVDDGVSDVNVEDVSVDDGVSDVNVEGTSADEIQDEKSDGIENEVSGDDKEVWETNEDAINQDDDAEVWESDEGVAPEDNAEVWEDDSDYAEGEDEEEPQSIAQKVNRRVKSFFKHDETDDESPSKSSFFSSLKFDDGLGENSDLKDEFEEEITEPVEDGKVDLGSDDDYIYVDHSNDEVAEEIEEPAKPDINDYVSKDEFDYSADEEPVDDEITSDETFNEENIKKPIFSDKINIGSDKDSNDDLSSVNVNHDIDDEKVNLGSVNVGHDVDDEKVDLGSVNVGHDVDDEKVDLGSIDDDVDSQSENVNVDLGNENVKHDINDEEKVDLGSDEDYIYVDHSNDEVADESETIDGHDDEFENKPQEEVKVEKESKKSKFVKSIISEVVNAESRLQPDEIETVRGEIIEEEDESLYRPAPKDDYVVEAEIVNGDNFSEEILEKPTAKDDYFEEDEELNIFTDELPDLSHDEYEEIHDEASEIIDKAMSEFMSDVFDKEDSNRKEDGPFDESIKDKFVDEEIADDINIEDKIDEPNINVQASNEEEIIKENAVVNDVEDTSTYDEVVYFKGATDVTNPLRKNNVYYNEHKNRSLKDSIKGFKKDMQYINKSLNEIENPTQIDYVSVVDRTEEYDPDEYLSRPSDDDSDRIIQMEEESTFDDGKSQRIRNEFSNEPLGNETVPDDVIVTDSSRHRREEIKDQALEDIIQTANDDYRQIEKERYQSSNKLKEFDDKKLPGKKKLEDDIIDYVQATDIGLTPQNDLYAMPIPKVAKSIKSIVDIEGPIHVKEVTTRVKDSCNIKRAGSNLKKTVNLAIGEAEKSGDIIKIGDFLYDASDSNVVIRKRNKPNIDLISDEEIAKSIELVLLHNQNVSTKQVAKEASRNFGFKSTSKKTASRINGVLDLMIANNRVKIVDDYVELN